MKNASVTIRMGAGHDELIVDGRVFDRAAMTKPERAKSRRMIREAFVQGQQKGTT